MGVNRIAVVGAGVAGLSSAWLLSEKYQITLYEKDSWLGGHAHTVDIPGATGKLGIDTGFVVYNEKNYPNLIAMFDHLRVETQNTDMSFSVSLDQGKFEYCGDGLSGLFAQRRNLINPKQWKLVIDILRFNRVAKDYLRNHSTNDEPLETFLQKHDFSQTMQHRYLLPMGAAIWSCPVETMMKFPARSFIQFCENHGLLDLKGRPQWRTVVGGSKSYVNAIYDQIKNRVTFAGAVQRVSREENKITVRSDNSDEIFDAVVFACHADQALKLLQTPSQQEKDTVGKFHYQDNHTWLHSDRSLMPRRKRVWSSWNYLAQWHNSKKPVMSATYWANNLHRLDHQKDYFISLNPPIAPAADSVIAEMMYAHPIFDHQALSAQAQLPRLQGQQNTWYCGSYAGYGFHEDALTSAINTCFLLGVSPPWENKSVESRAA